MIWYLQSPLPWYDRNARLINQQARAKRSDATLIIAQWVSAKLKKYEDFHVLNNGQDALLDHVFRFHLNKCLYKKTNLSNFY